MFIMSGNRTNDHQRPILFAYIVATVQCVVDIKTTQYTRTETSIIAMTTNSPFLFTKIINNKSWNDHATDLTYSIHQKRPIKYTFKIVILRMTTLDNSIYMRCQFVLHSKILNERIFLLTFS